MVTTEKTSLALDIDQTLADIMAVHLRHYNDFLFLGMSQEYILDASQQYLKVFDVPEIIEYRRQDDDHETEFQLVRSIIRSSEQVHRELEVIPYALEAIRSLSAYVDDVSYHTVRPQHLTEATAQWLEQNNFPTPDHLSLYTTPKEKIEGMLARLQNQDTRVILIDDSLKELLIAAQECILTQPELKPYFINLILVGFGYDWKKATELIMKGEKMGIDVIPLPNWEAQVLLNLIETINLVPNSTRQRS